MKELTSQPPTPQNKNISSPYPSLNGKSKSFQFRINHSMFGVVLSLHQTRLVIRALGHQGLFGQAHQYAASPTLLTFSAKRNTQLSRASKSSQPYFLLVCSFDPTRFHHLTTRRRSHTLAHFLRPAYYLHQNYFPQQERRRLCPSLRPCLRARGPGERRGSPRTYAARLEPLVRQPLPPTRLRIHGLPYYSSPQHLKRSASVRTSRRQFGTRAQANG